MNKAKDGFAFRVDWRWNLAPAKKMRFWAFCYVETERMFKFPAGYVPAPLFMDGELMVTASEFEPECIDKSLQHAQIKEIAAPLWLMEPTPILYSNDAKKPSEYALNLRKDFLKILTE